MTLSMLLAVAVFLGLATLALSLLADNREWRRHSEGLAAAQRRAALPGPGSWVWDSDAEFLARLREALREEPSPWRAY